MDIANGLMGFGGIVEGFLLTTLTAYVNGFSSFWSMYGITALYMSPFIIAGLLFGALKKLDPPTSDDKKVKQPSRFQSVAIWGILGALVGFILVVIPVGWFREDVLFRVFTGSGILTQLAIIFTLNSLLPLIIIIASRSIGMTVVLGIYMLVAWIVSLKYIIPLYRDQKQLEIFTTLLNGLQTCQKTRSECTAQFHVQKNVPLFDYIEGQLGPPPGGWEKVLNGMIALGRLQQAQTIISGPQKS